MEYKNQRHSHTDKYYWCLQSFQFLVNVSNNHTQKTPYLKI